MSDRMCNKCDLDRMRKDAKKTGLKVTTMSATWGMGGVDVFLHPEDISRNDLIEDHKKDNPKYFRAWFMEVSKQCAC